MVEPVALGERAGESVGRDHPLVDQDPLGRGAGGARGLDRVVDLALGGQLHLDDHVGQEARRGPPARGLRDAGPALLGVAGGRGLRLRPAHAHSSFSTGASAEGSTSNSTDGAPSSANGSAARSTETADSLALHPEDRVQVRLDRLGGLAHERASSGTRPAVSRRARRRA